MSVITSQLQQMVGRRTQVETQLGAARSKLESLRSEWALDESARIIGVHITEKTRSRVKSIFDGIGTAALQSVFGDGSQFSVEFDQTETQKRRAWLCVDSAGVKGNPTEKSGNSVAAILSTMLRRAVIILHPELRNIIFCDEPLEGIDIQKQPGMAAIDREMVDAHGLQMIIVTHAASDAYADKADVVVQVERSSPRKSEVRVNAKNKQAGDA